jgi:CheY-like chemotaxis protein
MQKKILIIDDSKTSLLLFESLFENSGYEVVSEIDSKFAYEKVIEIKPDLIVLDIMMPDIDGFQLLKTIKSNPYLIKIPVIVLSALHEIKTINKAIDHGAVAYIKKPINVDEVIKVINKHLNN